MASARGSMGAQDVRLAAAAARAAAVTLEEMRATLLGDRNVWNLKGIEDQLLAELDEHLFRMRNHLDGMRRPRRTQGPLIRGVSRATTDQERAPAPPAGRPAVRDAPGSDERPDPLQAKSAADLIRTLNEFRAWAGDTPYRVMAGRAAQLVSTSALQRALTGRALPPLKVVQAVIRGCGGREADVSEFTTAWRRIRTGRQVVGRHAEPPPLQVVSAGLG